MNIPDVEFGVPGVSLIRFRNANGTGDAHCRTGGRWVHFSVPNHGATLARLRLESEIILPLAGHVNTPSNREAVDYQLPSEATRTSGLRAGMVRNVFFEAITGKSTGLGAFEWLIDINFDLEIDTPWHCSTWVGDIHYYAHVKAQNHKLEANVVGSSWNRQTGGRVGCRSSVASALDDAVPQGEQHLEGVIQQGLATANLLPSILDVFLMPGEGVYHGFVPVANVRHEAALVIVAPGAQDLLELLGV